MPEGNRTADKRHVRERSPEPGDLADRAKDASLDPDEQGDVGGDQDIDTAETDADTNKAEPLKDRLRTPPEAPDDN